MLALSELRDLNLIAASAPGRPLHLGAASGLVRVGSSIYVIADDELHLGVFSFRHREPGQLIRLFEGVLPEAKADRKQLKPDLEALILLPSNVDYPHGALFALGSGSRPNRRSGVLLPLDESGGVDGPPRVVDLTFLLAPLEAAFPALNIEGATISGEEFRLFQRANSRDAINAVVRFRLADVLNALQRECAAPLHPLKIDTVDLGRIAGVPYGFTDATSLPGGETLFSAVAEDTENAYDDGLCVGAAVGILDRDGRLRAFHPLAQPYKIEGIDARALGGHIDILLVTDADDAEVPAKLLSTVIAK